MKKIIDNWVHKTGRHCASTALSKVMNFYGLYLNEAECFGIGEGLGFWYIEADGLNPSRMIHMRSMYLEEKFFINLTGSFKWERGGTPEDVKKRIIMYIDEGFPVIVRTDIFYLDYYESKTHFPGHIITIWGYDKEKDTVLITDTERNGLIELRFDSLLKSMSSNAFPYNLDFFRYKVEKPSLKSSMDDIKRIALKGNAKQMLQETGFPGYGIQGLKIAFRRIRNWEKIEDWQWSSRFTYQIIEKRGTGGGGFRKIYSEFLETFAPGKMVELMRRIGELWTNIAMEFKKVSESKKPDFKNIEEMLERQVEMEETFYKMALDFPDT